MIGAKDITKSEVGMINVHSNFDAKPEINRNMTVMHKGGNTGILDNREDISETGTVMDKGGAGDIQS